MLKTTKIDMFKESIQCFLEIAFKYMSHFLSFLCLVVGGQ